MQKELLASGVLTKEQLKMLQDDATEVNVKEKIPASQLSDFTKYWKSVGAWVNSQGGNITTLSGNKTDGRQGGDPKAKHIKILYNDAFNDVRQWIDKPQFSIVKAVSNHLRFIDVMTEEE